MGLFLEERVVSTEVLQAALRRVTLAGRAVPVLLGAAFKNKGVQPLLDAVVDYLPSPSDIPPVSGKDLAGQVTIRAATDEAPFSALAFKIMNDPYVGQLTYFRVYSGRVESGATVFNATKGKREKIGRLLRMHANKREDVKEVTCGNIAAAVGMRVSTTGDTLCDEKAPIVLELMDFPAPVISIAIEPSTQANQEKLARGAATPVRGGPLVLGQDRSRDGPDLDLGDGRAASGDHRRPAGPRVQDRGQRGPPPGRLPRDRHQGQPGRRKVHPPDRRRVASTLTS